LLSERSLKQINIKECNKELKNIVYLWVYDVKL
jgi:hypothetical protein